MQQIDTRRTGDRRLTHTRRARGLWCPYCQRDIQIEWQDQTGNTQHKGTDNENQGFGRRPSESDGSLCSAGGISLPVLVERLTPRETEVLEVLAGGGFSDQEIAKRLAISVRTVWKHLSNIYGKLGVSSRSEAIVWANRHLKIGWEDNRD